MPTKYFKIVLSDGREIHVFFETASGIIVNFVVKLVVWKTCIMKLFDTTAHMIVLIRIFWMKRGQVIRKIWFELLDNKQALDMAIKDLKDNYEIYQERFVKWLRR